MAINCCDAIENQLLNRLDHNRTTQPIDGWFLESLAYLSTAYHSVHIAHAVQLELHYGRRLNFMN